MQKLTVKKEQVVYPQMSCPGVQVPLFRKPGKNLYGSDG
jgi:hypothetical protein